MIFYIDPGTGSMLFTILIGVLVGIAAGLLINTLLPDQAGDIASRFDMTGATISYHLNQLKKADLVYETREKNFIYYSLNLSVFEEIMLWFNQFTNATDSEPTDSNAPAVEGTTAAEGTTVTQGTTVTGKTTNGGIANEHQ